MKLTSEQIKQATEKAVKNLNPLDGVTINALQAMNRADKMIPNLSKQKGKEFIKKVRSKK